MDRAHDDQRIVLYDVTFDEYSALRDAFDEPSLRMTFFRGVLELMSPSDRHEDWKKGIARLLEHWVFALDIPVNGHGSTTFRKRAADCGVEPDECWVVRRMRRSGASDPPDIVLEVIHSKPAIDKLDVYDRLRVPEVWFFERGTFTLHRRKPRGGYRTIAKSAFLPEIDLVLLARLAMMPDQHTALKQLQRHLRH